MEDKKNVRCSNECHREPDPPIRNCPDCGEVLNEMITMKRCTENRHARCRSEGARYCANCGKRL